MNSKVLGGILLIIGTTVGGGMLALPVVAAPVGLYGTLIFLLFCWIIMAIGAFLILEVSLWLPAGANLISMGRATLGRWGEVATWISYLLLLYALLSAYIAGGSDVLNDLLGLVNVHLPISIDSILFTGVLGFVVFRGIRSVDYFNRGLMVFKLGSLMLLIVIIAAKIHLGAALPEKFYRFNLSTVMVMITSFGFSIIIPSLRNYFGDDVKSMRLTLFLGALFPLVLYTIWIVLIMYVAMEHGHGSLMSLLNTGHAAVSISHALEVSLNNAWITELARFFTSICMLTSFLGVSLSMTDFLADGLKLEKRGKQGAIIYAMAFLPPLVIIMFYPRIFITALDYAGSVCIFLLVLIPALMAWSGRYRKKIAKGYRVWGGKSLLVVVMLVAVVILFVNFFPVIQS